ncbi:hypothetical protein F5144DRAFT_588045 [Chaetomium tenue]|uniref:Uncharacterized protein n=1 Tax=Chaetomium tenue TaxID=1854479 RepID=A0ACB7PKA1_9PEZI|nr:hypothetical protein F5144DRAFT_588045 [Chaetomium globosum]
MAPAGQAVAMHMRPSLRCAETNFILLSHPLLAREQFRAAPGLDRKRSSPTLLLIKASINHRKQMGLTYSRPPSNRNSPKLVPPTAQPHRHHRRRKTTRRTPKATDTNSSPNSCPPTLTKTKTKNKNKTHTMNTPPYTDVGRTEAAALLLALDLSRRQETERQALAEQRRLAMEMEARRERERIEKKLAQRAAERRRTERRELLEAEMAQAERDMSFRLEREIKARMEEELRAERERALDMARLEAELEKEEMNKTRELEEAAIAKAMQESIMSETTRKLIEKEHAGRAQRRLGAAVGQMMADSEAEAQTERMKRRIRGQSGSDSNASSQSTTEFAPPFATAPYPTHTNPNGSWGPRPGPAGYDYTSPQTFARRDIFINDNQLPRHWSNGARPGLIGETHATGWDNTGMGTEQWRGTTTERWDGVIHQQNGARDAYKGYKEVSRSTRRFL